MEASGICLDEDTFMLVILELHPEELQEHFLLEDSPYHSVLRSKYFLKVLCEKWNTKLVHTFDKFYLLWKKKYFFSNTTLGYQLKNYTSVFSTYKAVRRATRFGQDEFVQVILDKDPYNQSIIYNILAGGLERPEILDKYLPKYTDHSDLIDKSLRQGLPVDRFEQGEATFISDIIQRKPVTTNYLIGIIYIARILKDPNVLEDDYYLTHPNVDPTWTRKDALLYFHPSIARRLKIKPSEIRKANLGYKFPVSKRVCGYLDEIGYFKFDKFDLQDAYSFVWADKKLKERKYDVKYVIEDEVGRVFVFNISTKYSPSTTRHDISGCKWRTRRFIVDDPDIITWVQGKL